MFTRLIFRTYFDADDILIYFNNLAKQDIPTLEKILEISRVLVRRYASQDAYNQALSKAESTAASTLMKVPHGTPAECDIPATSIQSASTQQAAADDDDLSSPESDDDDIPEDALAPDDSINPLSAETTVANDAEEKKHFFEDKGFDGDRVLANEALFLMEAGQWVEAAYAVPEGDIGRVYEILLVSVFVPVVEKIFAQVQ
jgi:hypothetical protein